MSKSKSRSRKPRAARPLISEVMQARSAADAVLRRALAEPSFRRTLRKNPAAALRRAGIPPVAIEDVSREITIDGKPLDLRCTETCHVTCLVTCWLTGRGRLPGGKFVG